VGCAGTLRAPPAAKGPGGEGIEGLANAPTAHDPCIELDVGRGRCLDGELNGCGYCDMFLVGKIDRRNVPKGRLRYFALGPMQFDDEGFYPLRHLRRIHRTVFGQHFQCRMRRHQHSYGDQLRLVLEKSFQLFR
jgi:hypothetical protein